ncbi:MAG: iron ABC transporter permease [Chthoniobacteraceae bacterium]
MSAALVLTVLVSVGIGAAQVPLSATLRVLLAPLGFSGVVDDQYAGIVWWMRLPRACMAVLVGGGLSLAGASMQGLFRNPLAEPGIAGVSSGAALGAVSAIVFGERFGLDSSVWWQALAAFVTALAAMLLVQRLARKESMTSVARLLLAGIAITAISEAGVGLCTTLASNAALRTIAFWNLGSFSAATWTAVGLLALGVIPSALLLLRERRTLNALLLGEAEAGHLGCDVERVKRRILLLSALITGVCVAVSGRIWFVGLLCPHLVRLTLGTDHRWLMPGSLLVGGTLMVLADLVCRTVAAPMEIPLGIVTALLGAPFFLWLMRRERGF